MIKYFLLCLTTYCGIFSAHAQKQITIEDIYGKDTFTDESVQSVNWMCNGRYYSALEKNSIVQYDVTTGVQVATLVAGKVLEPQINISGYSFSKDEQKLLLTTQRAYIYRRSYLTEYYIYDLSTKKLQKLSPSGKQSNATFSPQGDKVAFTRNNNLFYVELTNMDEKQITQDGKFNELIHGSTDWVYEEEFYMVKAFWWSPDGKKIAYLSFDESQVKEYNMQVWNKNPLYPQDYRFKYPKAGENNSVLQLSIYHLDTKENIAVDMGEETDIYIPRVGWTKNADLLYFKKLNRWQNELEIYHANANTGRSHCILKEKSNTYVDVNYCDDLMYLNDGKHFLRTSEKDGFKHVYMYNMKGKKEEQITRGSWEVTTLIGVNQNRRKPVLYYISTASSPLERDFYRIGLDGKRKVKLSEIKGTTNINMSKDFQFYIRYQSTANEPLVVDLLKVTTNERVKNLKDNARLKATIEEYGLSQTEFFTISTTDGTELNAYMIKPKDFNAAKKYPVLMFQYSGPQSQQVADRWQRSNYYWHQMLVQKGYIIACVDSRGTGYRGAGFTKMTYQQLGKYEVIDNVEAAKYLGKLSYVDKDRIGIWGWSYGGYMSSLLMMIGADYFKTGIAVAPVSSWRFYDTIYTERYLRRPKDNPDGYDNNSPLAHVDKLKGNFLLIHGTGDDNVHFQHAVALQNALIKAGKQFQSFYYPDKTHGIGGLKTRQHLYTMMTEFILENL